MKFKARRPAMEAGFKGWLILFLSVAVLSWKSFSPAAPVPADNPEALSALREKADSNPNETISQFKYAFALYQQGKYRECLGPLNRIQGINNRDEPSLLLLGTVYLQLREFDSAEKFFKRSLEINPKNADALNNLSLVYYRQDRFLDALKQLEKADKLNPNNSEILSNIAAIQFKLNQNESAIETSRKILQLNPKSLKTYERLAQFYHKADKYDEVLKICARAKEVGVESSTLLARAGFAAFAKNDLKAAGNFLNKARQQDPGNAEVHFGLGLLAYKNADLDTAIQELKETVKLNPEHADAARQLAMAYEDQAEYFKALFYYYQVLKIYPDDASAKQDYQIAKTKAVDHFLRRGSQAYFGKDYKAALGFWEKALKLDPNNGTAGKFIETARVKVEAEVRQHNQKADALFRQNQQSEAYREWRLALTLDPKNVQALDGVARVKLKQKEKEEIQTSQALDNARLGNVEGALTELKSSLKTNPMNATAKKNVVKLQTEQKNKSESNYRKGIELFSSGRLREAIENLEQAQESDPNNQGIKNLLYKARTQLRENIKALMARGIELSQNNRGAEANEKFQEVLRLDPDNAEALNRMNKGASPAGVQTTASKEAIKKLYYDGVSLYLDGQNKKAIEVWQKILTMDPGNQEAKNSILKAEMELKEMEKRGIPTD